MTKLNFLLSMLLLCLLWLPQAQTPFIESIHYNSPSTDQIGSVYAFTHRSNGWFVGVGSANEPCNHQNDTMPVIFKIDPNGNLLNPSVICVDLGTSPKTFITKDVIEHPNGLFILCGKVKYPGASGGSAAFLLTVDTTNNAQRLIVYDNMLTANALVYNPNPASDYYVMVGQSRQDNMFSLTWDSIPCVLVLDGADPSQLLDARIVYDWGPAIDKGAFKDVKTVNHKEYYLTGSFRVYEEAYNNDDILFSVLEIDEGGIIQNAEHILINNSKDASDERGRRIAVNTLNEIYLCGESWEIPTQANQQKDFALIRITGSILPGNLINLSYDFREVDFNNDDRDIFATDIDYLAWSNAIAVTGHFLDVNGDKHPYIFHTIGFFSGLTLASDYYYHLNPDWDTRVERVSIMPYSERALAFGWYEDIAGESEVAVLGDTLYQPGIFPCRTSIVPLLENPTASLRLIVEETHDEDIYTFDPEEDNNVNLISNSHCQSAVYKTVLAENQSSTNDEVEPEIVNLGQSIEVHNFQGTFGLFNMMGQQVLEGRVEEGQKLHTASLVPGMYILRLKEAGFSAKFVR